jgi:hypothetical protein
MYRFTISFEEKATPWEYWTKRVRGTSKNKFTNLREWYTLFEKEIFIAKVAGSGVNG